LETVRPPEQQRGLQRERQLALLALAPALVQEQVQVPERVIR